jgi:aminomethyltransferase
MNGYEMNGYEELRTTAAWINLSGRGEIRATGEDRARLLHAMSTNDIQRLNAGQGCYVFFLSAQGRILADAYILNLGDSLWIDTEPETRTKLFAHVDKYIIADDVTLTDESDEWSVVGIEGPFSADRLRAIDVPVPPADYDVIKWGRGFVSRISATGQPGFRFYLPANELAQFTDLLQSAGVTEAAMQAVETVRLENGKPRYGADITERYLSQETNQMHAISFAKGCYLGQEIVERVRSRAQIHRVLSPVRIQSPVAPKQGTKLRVDEKDVGEITSSAFSPAFNEVVALAYIRVEQVQARKEMAVAQSEPEVKAYIP